jgi:spore coat protein A
MGHERSRRGFLKASTVIGFCASAGPTLLVRETSAKAVPTIADPRFMAPVIDPAAIPQFQDDLPVPGVDWEVIDRTAGGRVSLRARKVSVQVLPSSFVGPTPCWAYRGAVRYAGTYLGPAIVASKRKPVDVTYDYGPLAGETAHLLRTGDGRGSVVDKTLHGTDGELTRTGRPEPEVRFIAHLHGSRGVAPVSDGYAEAWVTPRGQTYEDFGYTPPVANRATMTYPNDQSAALLWYHDHALGITRLNVYAGLAAPYLLRDKHELKRIKSGQLPSGGYEVPLVVQDRMFYPDGRLAYPDRPWSDPAWPGGPSVVPEFFGDVMLVNGKAWPRLRIEPATYRFRVLNGCNSRFLRLSLSGDLKWTILGTEGGFLDAPVTSDELLMGPAERFDVIVDFSRAAGRSVTVLNKGARKPFPNGAPPDPRTDGRVMRFVVGTRATQGRVALPTALRSASPIPASPGLLAVRTRRVLLFEKLDEYGRVEPVLGTVVPLGRSLYHGTPLDWDHPVTERPKAGTTEVWEIFNTTEDAHPIHLHEVLFRVINRQPISVGERSERAVDGIRLAGDPRRPKPYETGLKDTVIAYPEEVTRILVPFTRTGRFVWHCHILEHEDNEMMRPYDIT